MALRVHSGRAFPEEVRSIFIVSGVISLVLAAYSLTLPHTPPKKGGDVDALAWRRAIGLTLPHTPPQKGGDDSLAWRRALGLLKKPYVAVLFFVTFIDSVVHNGYFVMSDAFLTNRVGIAGNLSMVVLSLGQVAEILTMLVLGKVLVKLGWRTTMIVGILGHAARSSPSPSWPTASRRSSRSSCCMASATPSSSPRFTSSWTPFPRMSAPARRACSTC
jgi:hypothetical protein